MKKAVALNPWFREAYLSETDGSFCIDGVEALPLLRRYGSPLYVYSEARLLANARALKEALSAIHTNTRICYASKACSNIAVLKIFKAEGLSIEVNSGGELFKALFAGYRGDQIVFNGVAKTIAELRQAIDAQIKAINVDSVCELERIVTVARHSKKTANIALRIIPEIQGGGTAGWATGSSLSKFGMTRDEFYQALTLIRQAGGAVNLCGIHCHIGSQVNDLALYRQEAAFLTEFIAELQHEHNLRLEHINLGGGFPKSYVSHRENLAQLDAHYSAAYYTEITYADVAEVLIAPLRRLLGGEIEILVEPGRSLVSDTAVLLTEVQCKKRRGDVDWLYLDAGYSVIFDAFISWYFHMINASRPRESETRLFRVVGPLCDSHDTYFDVEGETLLAELLRKAPALASHEELLHTALMHQPGFRELPAATDVGDVVALFDVGAYSLENMSQYCGRSRPAAVIIRTNKTVELIRTADTPMDLLNRDSFEFEPQMDTNQHR